MAVVSVVFGALWYLMGRKEIYAMIGLTLIITAVLGLGLLAVGASAVFFGVLFTVLYFLFFLLMPIYTSIETCKQPPERVTGGH